ncbi:hypothetical protein ACTMTI_52970 [Nonomuraea sp. H19]|uniref:hypothetical protein n=1 Tax=Nonomuraea sp. H19 TaxID=3452206 RepID=UPI003F88667A
MNLQLGVFVSGPQPLSIDSPAADEELANLHAEVASGSLEATTTTVRDLTGREPRTSAQPDRQRAGAAERPGLHDALKDAVLVGAGGRQKGQDSSVQGLRGGRG